MLLTTESAPAVSSLKDANGEPYTHIPDVSDSNYWSARIDTKSRSTHYVPVDKELHRRLLRKDCKRQPVESFQSKAYTPLKHRR